MRALRAIFLLCMTWLLVVFLPAHTRGKMTLGPRDATATAAAENAAADSCCSAPPRSKSAPSGEPTQRDRANCAVCHWAAGLLFTPPFVFDHSHSERAFEHAAAYAAQVWCVARRLTHHGRDPPSTC